MLGVCMALIDDEKDKKAFEKLYNKYKNKVHAISLNILKNEQLAEESTSDTFLSLAKCFQKIKHLEYHKLDYYIVITSRNMAKNISKKEKENLMTVSYDDDSYFVNENIFVYKNNYPIKDLSIYKKCGKGIKIVQLDKTTGELLNVFDKISDAGRYIGKSYKNIQKVLDDMSRTAYGYKWMRYEEYIKSIS